MMRLRAPFRLNNKLSKLSVVTLVGLIAFAAVVFVANPFANQTTSANANVPGGSSAPVAGQAGAGGQGSLLTTPPGGGSASGGVHHHHDNDGNSTVDS
jgi:predicted PurR-regulated permease PerM